MLTPEQIAVIDNIPDEGKAPFLLSDEERASLAQVPLVLASVARVPRHGDRTAKILIGAPGSGKSSYAFGAALGTVFISYDEGGALYDIPDYVEELGKIAPEKEDLFEPVSRDSLRARRELWLQYQNDSQNIRAQTLKFALKGQFSIVIDTTSSSIGTKFLIEALRKLPFKEITMEGMFAQFDISRKRIEERPRPTSGVGDLVGKRIGALEWIPEYAKMVDRFDFIYNPTNGAPPKPAFSMASGQVVSANITSVYHIADHIHVDAKHIERYLRAVKNNPGMVVPEDISGLDIDAMMGRYQAAAGKMTEFLDEVVRPSPAPAPGPAPRP